MPDYEKFTVNELLRALVDVDDPDERAVIEFNLQIAAEEEADKKGH